MHDIVSRHPCRLVVSFLAAGFTSTELVALYEEPVFIVYAIVVGLLSLTGYILSKYIEKVYDEFGAWSAQYCKWKKVCNGTPCVWLDGCLEGVGGRCMVALAVL